MEYLKLPSKLNDLSLEELDMTENKSIPIILEYIHDLSPALQEEIGQVIAKMQNNKTNVLGVTYDPYKNRWRARRKINGKTIFIAQSEDVRVAESAAIEFAKKNNLQVYR